MAGTEHSGSVGARRPRRWRQEAKLDALRSALEAGERSGPAKPLDFDAFVARKRKSAR
ncbi:MULTISPECIES: type II toxin-antitoxin system ParD family antitoxin [Caballeronia]|uniref:type II toxin-antitoxin system ParD family antitoxin n=1 Tax=Caballeronia TaxID=1827195 RepID=UPI002285B9E1|nr:MULTISPECIES: type II toxin-antitoxin system ParD family antitoxin [Caballeronia]MDR5791371.1 type II toxin-antitoxin system ParD family antitoxin [Caballeronia sp. LP003]